MDSPPTSNNSAPNVTLTGGANAIPTSTTALTAQEKMTMGRRRLPR